MIDCELDSRITAVSFRHIIHIYASAGPLAAVAPGLCAAAAAWERCDDGVENAGKSVETYGKILFFNSSICLFDVFFPIAVAYIKSYNLKVLWQFSSWVFEATSSPSLFFVDSWYVSTCITEDSSI